MQYFIATTFLLLGFIIGAIVSGVIIYRHFIDRDYGEFDNPTEEIELPDFLKKNLDKAIPLDEFLKGMRGKVDFSKSVPTIDENLINESKIKKLIEANIERAKAEGRWTDLTDLTELYNTIEDWFQPRKEWFASSIGKTIAPNKQLCDCPGCLERSENGVKVDDMQDAMKWFLHECDHKIENKGFEYIEFRTT